MKERLKKVFGFEIDKRLLALGTVAVLLVLMLPIARIMMYCVPWYDDFGYGNWGKSFWEIKHSLWDVLQGAIASAKSSYYAWQGTFSSVFLMSLMPAIWGTDKYVLGLWFVLIVLALAVFAIVGVLLREMLGADKWLTLTVQAVVTAVVVVLFRSPIEGMYWYNSAVHYTAMHSFGILLIAMLVKMIYTDKKGWKVVLLAGSVLLGAFIGGGNYVTVLQAVLAILSVLGFGLLFKKKSVLWVIPSGVSILIAMFFSVTAPGNEKRMAHFTGMNMTPVEAIIASFKSAVTYFGDFTGWMTLAVMILLIPVILKIVSKASFEFKYPALVLVWSFCLYATGFTPTLYTMGHTMLGRATNVAKLTFQILLFLNAFYLTGWGCKKLREKKGVDLQGKNSFCFYAIILLIMVGIFVAEPNKGGKYNTYCAYYFVHTGEAYNYYQEYLRRVEICESDEADVTVSPYVFKPWLICPGDLSDDPQYEPNQFMATYFGKNSITCVSPENVSE